jgi:hypothetical protein
MQSGGGARRDAIRSTANSHALDTLIIAGGHGVPAAAISPIRSPHKPR